MSHIHTFTPPRGALAPALVEAITRLDAYGLSPRALSQPAFEFVCGSVARVEVSSAAKAAQPTPALSEPVRQAR